MEITGYKRCHTAENWGEAGGRGAAMARCT